MKEFACFILAVCGGGLASAEVMRSQYKENICLGVNDEDGSGWRQDRNVEAVICDGDAHQQFSLVSTQLDTGETILKIQVLGQCLDIDGTETEPWTLNNNILIAPCSDSVSQRFEPIPQVNGWFSLQAKVDGRCLDIDMNEANGWRTARNVHLWQCHGEPNQLWKLEEEQWESPEQHP